jgi:hypothetical protein
MKRKIMIYLILGLISTNVISQSTNWKVITDPETGIEFSSPDNTARFDSLYTTLYGGEIDTTEAVQVHIFRNANITNSDPVFNEALIQENNDTLRAIARLMLLASDSDLTAIQEITTNGIKGLEIGITYKSLQSETPYHTFVRYYMMDGNFISFTWTGIESSLKSSGGTKDNFFNSVSLE